MMCSPLAFGTTESPCCDTSGVGQPRRFAKECHCHVYQERIDNSLPNVGEKLLRPAVTLPDHGYQSNHLFPFISPLAPPLVKRTESQGCQFSVLHSPTLQQPLSTIASILSSTIHNLALLVFASYSKVLTTRTPFSLNLSARLASGFGSLLSLLESSKARRSYDWNRVSS